MASTTPNIGLTLPTGAENVSRQIINDNNTKIDTAIGTLNGKFTTIVTSGSMHDLAGQNGLFWLTSAVTDKPTQSGGLLILRSYDATYCVGEYIDVDSGTVHSISLLGTTWATRRFNFYTGMKYITKVDGTYTSGSSGNIALGTSASTGKKVVIGAICTSMDAYVRIWYATNNAGWYATIVNPNTGATINNTQVTLTYWVIDTD